MRVLIVLLVAAAALARAGAADAQAGCGVLQACPAPTPAPTTAPPAATPTPTPAPVAAEVSLTSSRRYARYELYAEHQQSARLAGQLSSAGPVGGVTVRLRISIGSFETDYAEVQTDDQGRFAFPAFAPWANTTFRAVIADGQSLTGQSPARRVVLFPYIDYDATPARRSLRVAAAVTVPRALAGPAQRYGSTRRARFYVRLRGQRVFRRVASAHLGRGLGCEPSIECSRYTRGRIRDLALLRRTAGTLVCFPGHVFRDVGLPGRCPRRLRAR